MSGEKEKSGKAPLYFTFNAKDCDSFHDIHGTPWCSHPIVETEYSFGKLNDQGQRITRTMRSCKGCEYFGRVVDANN